jgi:2-methylisocitrate lyase-like PEP mutase family enzyme
MRAAGELRELLEGDRLVQAPGAYDALSARLIEGAGFPAVYMTGFGASASRLGAPDTGLLSFKEMADHAADLAAAVRVPLIADADTGYGNPANVRRTVLAFARAGVAGVQIEDQVWPKRCGHTSGKQVVGRDEALARVRAAVDAREERDVVIVARTDARAVLGMDEALDRCRAFKDAGADVLFVEAPGSREELEVVAEALPGPLLVNVLEGGATPVLPPAELEELGFRIAIYPLTLLYVAASALAGHLGQRQPFRAWEGPLSFERLRELVGFPEYDALLARYA